MNTFIFTGPIRPNEVTNSSADGLLLDFRPFQRNSVNETDARKIKESCAKEIHRFGLFDGAPLNQLLYLLSEDLINGVLLSRIGEQNLRRIAETTGKPLFLEGTCKPQENIRREQCMPIAGHFFLTMPDHEVLVVLNKPYILSMQAMDKAKEITADLRQNPPFALWCETPAETEKAKAWIATI